MPARSEVLSNWPIRGEEALHVPGGLEPLHASLPLTCGLMRVLGAIIEVAVLAVLHPREDLPLRSPVAVSDSVKMWENRQGENAAGKG